MVSGTAAGPGGTGGRSIRYGGRKGDRSICLDSGRLTDCRGGYAECSWERGISMMVDDTEYQSHPVFSDLDRYAAFYERLADSVFSWVPSGTRAIGNIDSYMFSSMQGTLASISTVLQSGRVGDAYALLRKYYDFAIINVYSCLALKDKASIENPVVAEVDGWLQGTSRIPEYRVLLKYICDSQRMLPISSALLTGVDVRYKATRSRCNDHMHYNFYKNVLVNDRDVVLRWRRKSLDELSGDIRDVLIMHVSFLFFENDHYMMSSDYRDSLECGMTPDPGSDKWVAPFVQEMFDQTISKYRPDVANVIKQKTSMDLK